MRKIDIAIKKIKEKGEEFQGENYLYNNRCPDDYGMPNEKECDEGNYKYSCKDCWESHVKDEECKYKSIFGCNHHENPETILEKERGYYVVSEHGRCLEELCPKERRDEMSTILICDRCDTEIDGEFLTVGGEDICSFCVEELLELEGEMTERTKKYLKCDGRNHIFKVTEDILDKFIDGSIKKSSIEFLRSSTGSLNIVIKENGVVVKVFGGE